jgi:hypothetical protein
VGKRTPQQLYRLMVTEIVLGLVRAADSGTLVWPLPLEQMFAVTIRERQRISIARHDVNFVD